MEIPTTSNIKALEAFQDVFNKHIRPVAEHEYKQMCRDDKERMRKHRSKLIPSSIVQDVMIYLTYNLSEFADEEVQLAKDTGDITHMLDKCRELNPYFLAARSLALATYVFGQDPADTLLYDEEDDPSLCWVCGHEADSPLSVATRKSCRGGCPECAETLEAVFPN